MPVHSYPSVCCKNFGKLALRYIDESTNLDARLETLASLCQSATAPEYIEPAVISGLGVEIRHYLERRRVLEHVFFDRGLIHWQEDNLAVQGEMKRLQVSIERV